MSAWDLYKQAKTNEHAPAWLQWMAAAWLIAIVAGILWYRFDLTTPDDASLKAAVGTAFAVDHALLDELEVSVGPQQSEMRSGLPVFRRRGLFRDRIAVTKVTAERASRLAREGEGQATVSVPADQGTAFCVNFHWYYRKEDKRLAGRLLRTDEVLTVDKLRVPENSGACP